jgi:hypothetical protein
MFEVRSLFLISARLTADGRQAAFLRWRFRREAERRTLNLEPRTLNQEKVESRKQKVEIGAKDHPKPPKATPKPYSRHILGIDSGVQSHPKATSEPPQSLLIGTSLGPQSHPKATPRLHQSHTKAPPKPPQGSTKATPRLHQSHPKAPPKPGKCGPTTRRWGRTRAVTLTGGEAAHLRTATSRRLDLPSGRALRPPSGHLVANR